MGVIYKLKNGVTAADFEELADYGYNVAFNSDIILKFVKQPLDGEATQFLLKNYYENPEWKKKFYQENKKAFKKDYDLKYNKDGTLKITPTMKELLTTWIIQIELEDGWVGFTHSDQYNKNVYYGKKVLDKYCYQDIFLLLSKGIIEEYEVSEEEAQ